MTTHAYAPAMGLTIREAVDQHAEEWKLSTGYLNGLACVLDRWERFSGDPKIRNIDDGQFAAFETWLVQDGCTPNTGYKFAMQIRRVVKRVHQGENWIDRQRAGVAIKRELPTRLDGTLWAWFVLKYAKARLRGRSHAQFRNMDITLRHFGRMLGHTPKPADLSNDSVGDLMQWLSDRGRSARTCNKSRDMLLALWRHLCREGKLRKWPTVEPFPEPRRAPLAWTRAELSRLFKACAEQTGYVGRIPAGLFWLTLVSLLWNSAERIGATMSLTWGDVDLDGGFARFKAEYRKGKTADNVCRLDAVTVELLRRFPEADPSTPVLAWPLCSSALWTHYRHVLKAAKLPALRCHKFHALRKSAATWFEIAGGNATDLLMHSSRQVTQSYLDPRLIGKTHAADLLFNPAAPEPKRIGGPTT